jgi:hypothetical protein
MYLRRRRLSERKADPTIKKQKEGNLKSMKTQIGTEFVAAALKSGGLETSPRDQGFNDLKKFRRHLRRSENWQKLVQEFGLASLLFFRFGESWLDRTSEKDFVGFVNRIRGQSAQLKKIAKCHFDEPVVETMFNPYSGNCL